MRTAELLVVIVLSIALGLVACNTARTGGSNGSKVVKVGKMTSVLLHKADEVIMFKEVYPPDWPASFLLPDGLYSPNGEIRVVTPDDSPDQLNFHGITKQSPEEVFEALLETFPWSTDNCTLLKTSNDSCKLTLPQPSSEFRRAVIRTHDSMDMQGWTVVIVSLTMQ